jgi:hypothetical protein
MPRLLPALHAITPIALTWESESFILQVEVVFLTGALVLAAGLNSTSSPSASLERQTKPLLAIRATCPLHRALPNVCNRLPKADVDRLQIVHALVHGTTFRTADWTVVTTLTFLLWKGLK